MLIALGIVIVIVILSVGVACYFIFRNGDPLTLMRCPFCKDTTWHHRKKGFFEQGHRWICLKCNQVTGWSHPH